MPFVIRKAWPEDFPAIQQMLELYQYELSDIWQQDADAEAKYGFSLERYKVGEHFHAHVILQDTQYAGLALVSPAIVTRNKGFWMDQFFILKRYRRLAAGRSLAIHVFQSHPGSWEIGQMPANIVAQSFWRHVIGTATAGAFVEIQVTEGWWQGVVQQFQVPAAA